MMTTGKSNKLTPFEQLKEDKRKLKQTYQEDAARLQDNWDYMTEHMGILLFNTGLATVKSVMKGKRKKEKEKSPFTFLDSLKANPSMSFMNIVNTALPFVWEIAQPMLLGLVVRKIKNLFSSKKKKK